MPIITVEEAIDAFKAGKFVILTDDEDRENESDLARLAGLKPAGGSGKIRREGGSRARLPGLEAFSTRHGIGIVTIADLIAHRRRWEKLVELRATAKLPTEYGIWTVRGYQDVI